MNLTEKQVIVVQALLWSISGGVLLILCLMIAITCILARKNLRTHHLSGLSSSRQRKDEFGQSEEMVQHKKLQSTRSMDTDMYVAPRTDFSTKSTKSYDRSANRHGSPTNSLEHHIYDDPDYILSCAKMGRAHYGNESDISSSRESNNYEKVHDYANAGSLRH
ncbi:uncharacterized protein LOC135215073 isoform X1 [Macrobrachium nipponense]|uniref:uncharacterized protein LOC135215073 isoform X1 n=1 Tax=Macrobrachium nipponense TaxID=159736 RepID=UPI0030C84EDE